MSAQHPHKVVKLSWTLKADGKHIDGSGNSPQTILLGHTPGLPPQLEQLISTLTAGQSINVDVPPKDAYGEHDPSKCQTVPRGHFPKNAKLTIGQGFYTQDSAGQPLTARVTEISEQTVTVDFNHEHSGKSLHYQITIHSLRDADASELEHGHVHGDGGINHDHHSPHEHTQNKKV